MSRVDNHVVLIGKVVKGPFVTYTKEGKLRVGYQIQIEPRAKDKGNVQCPFIRSVGNQAEKDKDNIKTGDMIIVEGRVITRMEKKKLLFVEEPAGSKKLKQINIDDEEGPIYDDDLIFESEIERPVTEIVASDVWYFHKFIDKLDQKEQMKLFSPKVLKSVLAEDEERFSELKDYLLNEDDD